MSSSPYFIIAQFQLVLSDIVVITQPQVNLTKGQEGFIPCEANKTELYSIQWNKGPTFSEAENIIVLDLRYNYGQKYGPGYENSLFDITSNLTLVIKNVTMDDQGRYFCEGSEKGTGTHFRNHTDVTVLGKQHIRTHYTH